MPGPALHGRACVSYCPLKKHYVVVLELPHVSPSGVQSSLLPREVDWRTDAVGHLGPSNNHAPKVHENSTRAERPRTKSRLCLAVSSIDRESTQTVPIWQLQSSNYSVRPHLENACMHHVWRAHMPSIISIITTKSSQLARTAAKTALVEAKQIRSIRHFCFSMYRFWDA